MIRHRVFALLVAVLAAAVAACGRDRGAVADTPLDFVPADTPFVFASLEPPPEDTRAADAERAAPLGAIYESALESAADDLEREQPGSLGARTLRALAEELRGQFSVEGMARIGLSRRARAALYGIGLVPVLRIELGDPAAFEAFVARLEARVGETLPRASVGAQRYWRVFPEQEPIGIAAAVLDGDLVLTLLPKDASEASVRRLLGIERPAVSLGDGRALTALNAEFGFTAHGSGYVDTRRLLDALLAEKTGIEREFLDAAGATPPPPASAVCRTEFERIAALAPRLVLGYTRLEPQRQELNAIVVLEPALAAALAKIPTAVPGLGAPSTALMRFGLSLDLDQASRFLGAQAAAVAAAPYQCETLAGLNQGWAALQSGLANPALFAAAAVVEGIHVELQEFELGKAGGAGVRARVALASDNPQSLVAMARGNVPQLATLDLKPGAAAVALPAGLAPPGSPPLHLALAERAIGIAVGDGAQAGLAEFIAAPGAATEPPLFAFGISGALYERLARTLREQPALAGAIVDGAGDRTGAESGATDDDAQALAQAADMLERFAATVVRVDSHIVATQRGIELRSSTELR